MFEVLFVSFVKRKPKPTFEQLKCKYQAKRYRLLISKVDFNHQISLRNESLNINLGFELGYF